MNSLIDEMSDVWYNSSKINSERCFHAKQKTSF